MTPTDNAPARLLVVDDLEVNRDLLARRVRRLGHEAGFAENGRAALAALRAQAFDLVLLDINMPEMDGYDTLREIKADPALAALPVIMVSAIDETESVVRCLELGADDYLTKPFNPVILQARIESSLNKKRLADQKQATMRALERELEIGRRIQRGFLPATLPQPQGWEMAALCTPARQVGGDFYDALPLPDGRLALAIADVCDKGVGAALYMALFRSLLRASLLHGRADAPADELLARAVAFTNDYIAEEHGRDNMFATLFIAVLAPDSGELVYLNAGHEAPLLRRTDGRLESIEPAGLAVGVMSGQRPATGRCTLAPGDVLLGFTDGVTESVGDGGAFGEDRTRALLEPSPSSAAELVARVDDAVRAHAGRHPPHDDLTVLVLRRRP